MRQRERIEAMGVQKALQKLIGKIARAQSVAKQGADAGVGIGMGWGGVGDSLN